MTQQSLLDQIKCWSKIEGLNPQRVPEINTNYYAHVDHDWLHMFYSPSVLFVVQGEKQLMVGHDSFKVGAGEMVLFPVAMPLEMRVTVADQQRPFLGVSLTLKSEKIAEFLLRVFPNGLSEPSQRQVIDVADTTEPLLNAVTRVMAMIGNQKDEQLLIPLVIDELLIRLLQSPLGVPLATMGLAQSKVRQVSTAINWLQANYAQPVHVQELATLSQMSVSRFHESFKAITGMSPIQYQKVIRLRQAKTMLLSQDIDVQSASQLVGYLSPSQFNRDYHHYFGITPKRDIMSLQSMTE